MKEEVNTRQLFIGFNILVLGASFYYFFRPVEHTYFLKLFGVNPTILKDFLSPVYATIGNSLPTFIHIFAFSLITASLIASQKNGYVLVCLFWFIVDVIFEIAQFFGSYVSQVIPNWFSNYLFLENTRNYFLKGSFDYLDLLSIALGSLAAYTLLIKTMEKKEMADEK